MKTAIIRGSESGKPIPVFSNHEKFLKNITIDQESGCWNWSGVMQLGYGCFCIKNELGKWKAYKSHRISYELFIGKIKPKFLIDHICKNKKCINPDHLRQVTARINSIENSSGPAFQNSLKTHCSKGHELTEKNTHISKINGNKKRTCVICKKERNKKSNLNQKILKLGKV